MRHTVLELVRKPGLAELGLFETDLVLQGGRVSERYLLVQTFLSHSVLTLEGVEGRNRQGNVRQRENI